MRGRLLVNALLLLAAVLLAIWLYRSTNETAVERLSVEDPAAVQTIEVRQDGERRMAFARGEGSWRIVAPRELPASHRHLEQVLGFLQRPVAARYPREQIDLSTVGLAEPMLVLIVDGRRYAFGALEPLAQQRYLLHDDEVLLVQEGVSALLASPWWNFIDRRLLPTGEPRRLHFADGRSIALDTERQAQWRQAYAAIAEPLPQGVVGQPLLLELQSGEVLPWQWLEDEQPRLLRPDLQLQYKVAPELLSVLLGSATMYRSDAGLREAE